MNRLIRHPLTAPDRLSALYHLLSVTLLTWYGHAVCPYVDSLSSWITLLTFAVFFALGWFGKTSLWLRHKLSTGEQRSMNLLVMEWLCFLLAGACVGLFNLLVWEFPLGSAAKIILGSCTIGVFASVDVALSQERQHFTQSAPPTGPGLLQQFFPVSRKLGIVVTLILLLYSSIMLLVIIKDLGYVSLQSPDQLGEAIRSIAIDIVFVVVVLVSLCLRLVLSFTRNLKLLFQYQLEAMNSVQKGDFAHFVPIVSHDEFGLIALKTNEMIGNLAEKAHIQTIFGKVVSPLVAKRLMAQSFEELKTGRNQSVAIVFCDLRNFTSLTESANPAELVSLMNQYFQAMVEIVNQHHGVVDKFIGDAVLAVFGLEETGEAAEQTIHNAVTAALAMRDAVTRLQHPLANGLANGAGVHYGEVISGALGSSERFEYTVIGDAVNTASRVEGLCKRFNHKVVITEQVYLHLPADMQSRFVALGKQAIRGKQNELAIYGSLTT